MGFLYVCRLHPARCVFSAAAWMEGFSPGLSILHVPVGALMLEGSSGRKQRLAGAWGRRFLCDHMPEAERQAIWSAAGEVKRFAAGENLAEQHSSPSSSLLLASGVAARYSLLEMGDRQITAFHIVGDFVDLHAFLLSRLDHGVSAPSST